MAGETVLIIDDSAELRSVLETILPYGGYAVCSAGSGEEGLALVSQEHPDLIMVDLELPDTNGLKVLEKLSEQGLTTPTIMMTGYGSEGVAARALRLGVKDYLIKPFTTEEVLSSVERALAESRLRQEKKLLTRLLSGHIRDCKLISAVGQTIITNRDPATNLQRIVGAAFYITRAEAAFLLLKEADSETLRLVVAEGRAGSAEELSTSAGDERLRIVLKQCAAVRLEGNDPHPITLQTCEQVQAVLQVPLQGRDRAVGLLSVDRRTSSTPFTQHDEQKLTILADFAVLALEQERQQADEARAQQETSKDDACLTYTAALLQDVVMITDPQGTVQFVSPALAELLGRPAQRLVGRRASALFPEAQPDLDLAGCAMAAPDHKGWLEVKCRLSQKQHRTLALHLANIPGPQGQALGILGIVEEIEAGQ